jgi:hypothetical protein
MLKNLLVADDCRSYEHIVWNYCRRVAQEITIVRKTNEIAPALQKLQPEVLLLVDSMLPKGEYQAFIEHLKKYSSHTYCIFIYQEMSLSEFEKLNLLKTASFLVLPVKPNDIYEAISHRYPLTYRRSPRYPVSLNVNDINGTFLGYTVNLSSTGMRLKFFSKHLQVGDSLLLQLCLPDHYPEPLVIRGSVLEVMPTVTEKDLHPSSATEARLQLEPMHNRQVERLVRYLEGLSELMRIERE